MSIKLLIDNIDVSDYVIMCTQVPIFNRNRDYSFIAQGFSFNLMKSCPVLPQKDQEITVSLNNKDIFLGYIQRVKFNYKPQAMSYGWNIEVKHYFEKLSQYLVNKSTFVNGDKFVEHATDWTNSQVFTVNASNRIIKTSHGLTDGTRIVLTSTITLPTGLKKNHIYYVMVYSADEFYLLEDFADYMEFTAWNQANYPNYVTFNSSTGSGVYSYSTVIDLTKYNDFSFYRDLSYTKLAANNQFFANFFPGKPQFPFFPFLNGQPNPNNHTIIAFDCEVGGSLPGGLSNNRAYYSAYSYLDTWFLIYNSRNDYLSDNSIVTTSSGIGQQWFSVIKRVEGNVVTKYSTSIVQIRHFIITAFNLINVQIDTSEIDNIIFYKYTTEFQKYKWTDMYFMESLLYNINQNEPSNPEEASAEYQITVLELLQQLFSIFGLCIELVDSGTKSYKLHSQKRNVDGVIQPLNEDVWVINSKDQKDYVNDYVYSNKQGYYFDRELRRFDNQFFYSGSGLSWFYNERKIHKTLSEQPETFEKYVQDSKEPKKNIISFYKNMVIFLRDLFEYRGPYNVYQLRDGSLGREFLEYDFNTIPYSSHANKKNALFTHNREEFKFRSYLFNQNIYTQKEAYLNIEEDEILLIQERNLMNE